MSAGAVLLRAFMALGAVQEPGSLGPALASHVQDAMAQLKDPDPQARQAAVMMLSLAGPKASGALPALLEVLKDPVSDVRAFAALALADIDPTGADVGTALERLLVSDVDGSPRAAAAAALGKIGRSESVDPLIKALHDSDNRTRLEAIRALAAIKHGAVQRALPAVNHLLKDSDPIVAAEAAALAATLAKR
jgi:HEAT repeat protein